MMNQLTNEQKKIHERAKTAGRNHARAEWEAIESLRDVQRENVHRLLGKRNLYTYAVEEMGLSEGSAYAMAAIAKKTFEVAEILPAITAGRVSANKMSRMLSVITQENARELIEFATESTTKELDFKVASINPTPKRRTSVRAVAGDRVRVAFDLSLEEHALIERARELIAKEGKTDLKDAVLTTAREFVGRRDPLAKAERAMARKERKLANQSKPAERKNETITPLRKSPLVPFTRIQLKAEEIHAVNLRDKCQCTFIDAQGRRCSERKHLEIHHVIRVSLGGTNALENLTTLCSFHHDLIHQLSLPIEGQVSWIREPTKAYVA